MTWITLPRNLLEQQLDALGIEKAKKFETGIEDPDSVNGTENLNDYPDYHMREEDDLGPEYTAPAPAVNPRIQRGTESEDPSQ